jgi:ABC-type nitrate/sulfonate/bicarbonate transport system permease component
MADLWWHGVLAGLVLGAVIAFALGYWIGPGDNG